MSFLGIGGDSTKTDRGFELKAMGNLNKLGGTMATGGMGTLAEGKRGLQSVMNQLQKIMGGGQAGLQALGPQVNTVASQYQAGRKAAAEFAPRGGGRTSSLSDTGFKEMGDIQNMLFTQAGEARGQAGELSGLMAQLGLSEAGTGGQMSEAAADIGLRHAPFGYQQQQDIGAAIGQLLAMKWS
jgi:hypothetical protein